MKCRLCSSENMQSVFSFGNIPVSNHYPKHIDTKNTQSLNLFFCEDCYTLQIENVTRDEDIFTSDYSYLSSYSDSLLEYSKQFVEHMMSKFKPKTVLEIGSNDGYLLQYIPNSVYKLGVDPSEVAAEAARKKYVITKIGKFGNEFAKELGRTFDFVIINNVLAHNLDANDLVKGLVTVLASNGVVSIEVQHALKLVKHTEFDNIYHEHYYYYSLLSLKNLLERNGLKIFEVLETDQQGGSLRLYCTRQENNVQIHESVEKVLNDEKEYKMNCIEPYTNFAAKINKIKTDTRNLLSSIKRHKKKIIGYGASAKGSMFLNFCDINDDLIPCVIDRNPNKVGRYISGRNIPIKNTDFIIENKPDYIFILSWNLREEIINSLSYTKEWGVKFITAIPEISIT